MEVSLFDQSESVENLKSHYDQNGFVVIPSFFSPQKMELVEQELQAFVKDVAPRLVRDEINYTSSGQVNSIHRLGGEDCRFPGFFHELLNSKKMLAAAQYFLDDTPVSRKVEYFAKPARSGMKSPWHQDNYYWCVDNANALTFWLALDGADSENGGVTYISGSHKWGLLPHVDSFAPGSSQRVQDLERVEKNQSLFVCPKIKPGDVLVHHSLIVHGSEDNKSDRSRRGVTFSYMGQKSKYDEVKLAEYRERLNRQVEERLRKQES